MDWIERLLDEQAALYPVERFARLKSQSPLPAFQSLIPLSQPAPGEQFAFQVDLDQCSGCKACVSACHHLNGLDSGESWRTVGTLRTETPSPPAQWTVTTACHHCIDPACMNGCPVLAYDKDPITGIVRHLDDQCIGCQYCVMMCPYEVPKFSASKGIVRKCDMCHQRLAQGEAPACVSACPNQAISITTVSKESVVEAYPISKDLKNNPFLPDSPPPHITRPTTRFLSERIKGTQPAAADASQPVPSESHLPLVWMLTLSQWGFGIVIATLIYDSVLTDLQMAWTRAVATLVTLSGLVLGSLHLGRPLHAWKSFLGWKRSWLSRELLVFGAYAAMLILLLYPFSPIKPFSFPPFLETWLPPLAFITGLTGIFSSGMIYVATQREYWSFFPTHIKFFGSAAVTFFLTALVLKTEILGLPPNPLEIIGLWTVLLVKLSTESLPFLHSGSNEWTSLKRSAALLTGSLKVWTGSRALSALLGCVLLTLHSVIPNPLLIFIGTLLILGGDWLERSLFFKAVSSKKMPGSVNP